MRKEISSTVVWHKEGIRNGEPLVKGSRVPVKDILNHLALGWSVPQLKELFPTVQTRYVKKLLQDISKQYERQ